MKQRTVERIVWLLRYLKSRDGFCVAWDAEAVDKFVREFPEAENSLRYYLMGPHSSPMLNDTAAKAKRLGLISAGHIGNQNARSYNQRTWCRCWTITEAGLAELERHSSLIISEQQKAA